MGDALKRRKLAASLAALALGLTLAGCGNSNDPEPGDTATSTSTSADGGSSPTVSETGDGSSDSPSSSPDPSASGDWWPEQPETMATGQEFPDNFEPATLEHPARNVPKPVMPEEAKQETEAGAQAFLDYYSDVQWYSFQTGDTSLVREITSESCEKCITQYDETDAIYNSGSWASGGFEKTDITPESFAASATGIYTLPVNVNTRGVKVIEDNKVTVEQEAAELPDSLSINLDYSDGKWVYITASPRET